MKKIFCLTGICLVFLFLSKFSHAQAPINDLCINAIPVNISGNGFGIGVFNSATSNITDATMQAGESVPTALLQSGLSQKSVWYRFSIPTNREVKVSLFQQGTSINAGDVGFSVYKTSQCIPNTTTDVSQKLTPIPTFGSTSHVCTSPGEYLVQVSSKAGANGIIYISVETNLPAAAYDRPSQAYDFGTLTVGVKAIEYEVNCQSMEDENETCPALGNFSQYKKTSWHVFKTPNYYDYIGLLIARQTNSGNNFKIGYKIYTGDVRAGGYTGLPVVISCDSIETIYTSAGRKTFLCDAFEYNTTYSIQLFFHEDFEDNIRVALSTVGTNPTQAPQPTIAAIPSPTNALGTLPSSVSGITTNASDYFACNARHSIYSCENSMPSAGLPAFFSGYKYNLSSFFTFTLAKTSEVSLSGSFIGGCSQQQVLMRLYQQGVTNSCTDLNTSNIVGTITSYYTHPYIKCLEPGTYTLQVMGTDSILPLNYYSFGSLYNSTNPICILNNLGQKFSLGITVKELVNSNKFNLKTPGAFDSINVVNNVLSPLVNGITYQSKKDTFGCANTVLPWDTTCNTGNKKAIYRQFIVSDSSVMSITGSNNLWWKIYQGDANSFSIAQNVSNFPDKIQGLDPITKCLTYNDCMGTQVCLEPGTYTHVSFGSDDHISFVSEPAFMVKPSITTYNSPQNAENLGDILSQVAPGGSVFSNIDYFSCKDNAIAINGYEPCQFNGVTTTKAIYRQFYLSEPASINISNYYPNPACPYSYNYGNGVFTVFSGKISDGLSGVQVLSSEWRCKQSVNNTSNCNILPAGWYTVVSYGTGPTFSNPLSNVQVWGAYSSHVSWPDRIQIGVNAQCAGPKYNRPHKAAIDTLTNQPFLFNWGPRAGHTAAYPRTDTSYTLYTTYFNCTNDTPFVNISTPTCGTNFTKVSYYVFKTVQESYLRVDTKSFMAAIYGGDARLDSAGFLTSSPIQTCLPSSGQIQICRLQPGTYTLIIYGYDYQNCHSLQPQVFIDRVGYSRFDFAASAYDFGTIPPDSTYHNGKVGDVNPIDAGRAASSDIFYCTTGASQTDVSNGVCYVEYKPEIYNPQVNNPIYSTAGWGVAKRNLWYSFVVQNGGNVRVKVENKSPGSSYPFIYSVYKSDVDGSLPFSTIAANGMIDSTTAQGLTPIVTNSGCHYPGAIETSFYRSACSPVPERYYIVVDIPNTVYMYWGYYIYGLDPNKQVDVSILLDSVNAVLPLYDHYANAGTIGTNLSSGVYSGPADNYSCATMSGNEPSISYSYCAFKTLWYKFSANVTGKIRYRVKVNNTYLTNEHILLFKELIPGDSTIAGLKNQNPSNGYYFDNLTNSYWNSTCLSPGNYYILLTGCYRVNETAIPEIQIIEEKGDFCSAPMLATLNGPGSSITPVTVDCHTIGTDYGEFNPTLSCPSGAQKENYKTSWFRLDITGTDTLDVTTYLTENTTATSSQIKYRMMDGNCGAMQERSCVQDALTQDTYKCLLPGKSYFFQVFTPVSATGTINLNLSAVIHVDTCATEKNCLSTAVFIPQFDCTINDSVRFTNLSTFGTGITYEWDFGYNNQTSTAVSPVFAYPLLETAQTYTVVLKVTNSGCSTGSQNVDSVSQSITMPGRPSLELGKDTIVCTPYGGLQLNATSWPGTTYQWNSGQTSPIITASYLHVNSYSVVATFNGCIKRDTIKVGINPMFKLKQQFYLCGNDSILLNSFRGNGETYSWNTGSTSHQVYGKEEFNYINHVNWKGCSIIDSFILIKAKEPFANKDTTICYPFQSFSLAANTPGSTSYSWSTGSGSPSITITNPGIYSVQVLHGNCYKKDTIQVLTSDSVIINSSNQSICAGSNFILPWGAVATSTGMYSDTIKYASGCDSLVRKVYLNVTAVNSITSNPSICAGQNHILPWGSVVSNAGTYRDTLRTQWGCDSIIHTVNLSINTLNVTESNETICASQSYILPWGQVVTTGGSYSDTLHYLAGCDSLIRKVNLSVLPANQVNSTANICSGQSFTLPWGAVVNTSGTYSDTLHYVNGCDSLLKFVTLTVDPPSTQNISASICEGQSYTLPWGALVSTSGIYNDTLQYISGCDSLVTSVSVDVKSLSTSAITAVICQGSSYLLPSGISVTASGTYSDTLHYLTGCDSLIRTVNLSVHAPLHTSQSVSICSAQSFTLPWGITVSSAGIYKDTIAYATTGCDSLIQSVHLVVNAPVTQTVNASICSGQTYVLPWGAIVSAAGIYSDTLPYPDGCDSLVNVVNLQVQSSSTSYNLVTLCAGQSYTLPWGTVVSTSGLYADTLSFTTGCDSAINTVDVMIRTLSQNSSQVSICAGSNYTLPWGTVVSNAGSYADTLHYPDGCDSLINTIVVNVQQVLQTASTATICDGNNLTLPWGTVINMAGIYRDTVPYMSGCDSLIRQVTVTVQNSFTTNAMVSICQGQSHILPWGTVVSATGIYSDTIHYLNTGCDSLIRVVSVDVKTLSVQTLNATTCSGVAYLLPWGTSVSASGVYSDTMHYANGCDSLIRTVNLHVTAAASSTSSFSICSDQTFTLPWGAIVSASGMYSDTVKTSFGCDSLIRIVQLTVNPVPAVQLSKSNDINCILGTANLSATGGTKYMWAPASSLNHATVFNPVASPTVTTMYHVKVTSANNCITEDSILVNVDLGNAADGYYVASAFTPDGDGKNDCFGVRSWGAVTDLKFSIFSRWGEMVFTTTDPLKCWDGTYKKTQQGSEVFVYVITAKTICGPVMRKGTVTLIR